MEIVPLGRDAWIGAASGFCDHNYRQSWDFGVHSAARVGAVSEHVAIVEGTRTLGLADVRIKRVPIVGGGIAYVTGGPLTHSQGDMDVERFVAVADALRREYSFRRGLVLRLVPPVGPATWNSGVAQALTRAEFVATEAVRGYRTMLVPLARPLEAIRRGLDQKWRNCLNRSEREGLVVKTANDVAALERFGVLFDEFVTRKGFGVPLPPEFYARVQADLPESERFTVTTAERDGVLLAGHVASTLGDTSVYLLGATSREALTCKAAYLLQWSAVRLAHERGCRWYDLGGIDPEGNPGVFHFKEGMGGIDVAAGPMEWRRGARARLVLELESRYRAVRASREKAISSTAPAT